MRSVSLPAGTATWYRGGSATSTFSIPDAPAARTIASARFLDVPALKPTTSRPATNAGPRGQQGLGLTLSTLPSPSLSTPSQTSDEGGARSGAKRRAVNDLTRPDPSLTVPVMRLQLGSITALS